VIFESPMDEVTKNLRNFHNEELHNFYPSPDTVTVIISTRITCIGQGACIRKMRNAYKILLGKS
jgi:hypothetical protein